MAYRIDIVNGTGSKQILNGNYSVTSEITGYDNLTINPQTVDVTADKNNYAFTISADGTLTVHVSEEGTAGGTAVVGATFIRCDNLGTTYGTQITSDTSGNAIFANVPYDATNAPIIYFKQTASDGSHEFSGEIKQATLNQQTGVVEVQNAQPVSRTVSLTDANYEGLPLTGTIELQ